ncbi:hypothetical protein Tco_1516339 [Tanacetum coccineum]
MIVSPVSSPISPEPSSAQVDNSPPSKEPSKKNRLPYPSRVEHEKKEKLIEMLILVSELARQSILKKLPEKLGDPDSFLSRCNFSELKCKVLADLELAIGSLCVPKGNVEMSLYEVRCDVKTIYSLSFPQDSRNCVRKWATSEFVKDNVEVNHEVFKSDSENSLGIHDDKEEEIAFLEGKIFDPGISHFDKNASDDKSSKELAQSKALLTLDVFDPLHHLTEFNENVLRDNLQTLAAEKKTHNGGLKTKTPVVVAISLFGRKGLKRIERLERSQKTIKNRQETGKKTKSSRSRGENQLTKSQPDPPDTVKKKNNDVKRPPVQVKGPKLSSVQSLELPILQPGEYDLWKMRIEQYLQCIDYTLWEIVENGNAPIVTKTVDGKETVIPPTSIEEKAQCDNHLNSEE